MALIQLEHREENKRGKHDFIRSEILGEVLVYCLELVPLPLYFISDKPREVGVSWGSKASGTLCLILVLPLAPKKAFFLGTACSCLTGPLNREAYRDDANS